MNFNFKKLPPFKWFVLQNFPFIEADFDAITYYQLLCKIVEYLNKVIDENNLIGEQTENLTNAFNELQDYVNHYFDNLDIQEEINNKLDEMAESGELVEIIEQYLQLAGILAYDNLNTMKTAENLTNGSIVKTLGYEDYKDGNGNFYKIRNILNTDIIDNKKIVALRNKNLIAELIEENYINVKKYGVYGDGIHDDTLSIQYIIDNFNNRTIYFPDGNYLISNKIVVKQTTLNNFKLSNNAKIFSNTEIDCIFEIGIDTTDGTFDKEKNSFVRHFTGGILDCENSHCAIKTTSNAPSLYLKDVVISNVDYYGIIIDKDNLYNSSNAYIENIYITGKSSNSSNSSTAIQLNGFDNKLQNILTIGTKKGIEINSAGNMLTKCHCVTWYTNNTFSTNEFNNTIAFEINGADNTLQSCYSDTYGISFNILNENRQRLIDCFTFFWQSPNNAQTILVNLNNLYNPKIIISNTIFNGSNGNCKIINTSQYFNITSFNNLKLLNNIYNVENSSECDLAYNLNLNNKSEYKPFTIPATPLETNKNYLLGYIQLGTPTMLSFNIKYGGSSSNNIVIFLQDENVYGIKFNQSEYNSNSGNFNIVVADIFEYNGQKFAKLVLQTLSDVVWSQIDISQISGNNLYSKEMLTPSNITLSETKMTANITF